MWSDDNLIDGIQWTTEKENSNIADSEWGAVRQINVWCLPYIWLEEN